MDAPGLGAMTDDQTSKLVGPASVRFHLTPREGDVRATRARVLLRLTILPLERRALEA